MSTFNRFTAFEIAKELAQAILFGRKIDNQLIESVMLLNTPDTPKSENSFRVVVDGNIFDIIVHQVKHSTHA